MKQIIQRALVTTSTGSQYVFLWWADGTRTWERTHSTARSVRLPDDEGTFGLLWMTEGSLLVFSVRSASQTIWWISTGTHPDVPVYDDGVVITSVVRKAA